MPYSFREINYNICGSRSYRYIGRRIPRILALPPQLIASIVQCRRCGLIYPNPMPFADAAQIQENYSCPDAYFPLGISEGRLAFYKRFLTKIEAALGYKGRLLDIGCGRGEFVHVAKSAGWDACGLDYSVDFAEYARKRFGIDVLTGDIASLDIAAKSFDAVSFLGVLQHTYDPRGSLLAAWRILKKGGVIFLETMNNASLIYKIGDLYYRMQGRDITTHLSPTFPCYQIYGFTSRTVRYLFKDTGFETLRISTRGGISKMEKAPRHGARESLLRLLRKLVMLFACFIGKGQVLESCGKKY